MKYTPKKEAKLVLEDGTVFHGTAAGLIGTTTGEIAFNTGMTGYQEVFTDPSYYGQVLIMNTAHIGNYGTCEEEVESGGMKIKGMIIKKFSENYSRPRANMSLDDYCKKDGVVAIADVDTRALVRHIRNQGAQNCIISSEDKSVEELKEALKACPSMEGLELSSKVSCKESYTVGNGEHKIALLDLGVKKNIIRCLVERNCTVKVYPYNTSFEEMEAWNPDGFMLSNGPGDPSAMPEQINTVKKIVDSGIPTFGICLGHQVLALSQGLSTKKMHNGHRGINHPIKNLLNGKGEITSQNHGFVVDRNSFGNNSSIKETHVHLNDDTVAGIAIEGKEVFSVQYHPEASAGPHDSRYLFDQFIESIVRNVKQTA